MSFDTKQTASAPDAIAPDGSEVRVLCRTARGSMAQFTLPPGAISRAVAHRTVEEVWCFISGRGRIWRRLDGRDEITQVGAGTSVSLPVGTRFQFRCDGDEPLVAVGVTMPPWPGEAEAYAVEGYWQPTA
jgi:mannose-6-phosphate isomerase-like protein (cupin superfamily)